jgi:hypothetical protein
VPARAVPDVAAGNLDLLVLALLAIFATGGFAGAFLSLLKTGKPPGIADVPLTLLIPATGSGVDLARLAGFISAQWLTPQRTVFIVESADDPAYGRLKQALPRLPGKAEIFVAGLATASAQKSHNLARALAHYDDGSRIIVLADADIVPQPHWLADIVQPLVRGKARMVSGYRWALPMDCRPGTLIGAWTERAIASLPKPPWYTLAWGGSIGFTPGTPARIKAVPVLEKAVSDDISLAHAARRNGIDVLYRKRLLVPTPVSHSLAALMSFGARQYQMLRLHQRAIWWTALPVVALAVVLKSWLWWHAFTSAFWLPGAGRVPRRDLCHLRLAPAAGPAARMLDGRVAARRGGPAPGAAVRARGRCGQPGGPAGRLEHRPRRLGALQLRAGQRGQGGRHRTPPVGGVI